MHACAYTCNIHVVVVASMTKTLLLELVVNISLCLNIVIFGGGIITCCFPCKNGGSLNLIHCYYYNYEMVFLKCLWP
jgi:hypothetical protein